MGKVAIKPKAADDFHRWRIRKEKEKHGEIMVRERGKSNSDRKKREKRELGFEEKGRGGERREWGGWRIIERKNRERERDLI